MATVHEWTGLEARALRRALRMSVRVFAEHLGFAVNTVSKWEKQLVDTKPKPDSQAILDTALAQAGAAVHLRFETYLSETEQPPGQPQRVSIPLPRSWEYESWTDDLDRAVVALSRQSFGFACDLLKRWTSRFRAAELDERGLYLLGRSTALLGDLQRDQGNILGPASARHSYGKARSVFTQMEIPRRVAQLDLSLAVVAEMAGELDAAVHQYELLAVDNRLARRDRARARLWVGTALSKDGHHDYAARVMQAAIHDFEDLGEPEDWSVAHQKLALTHRGAGNLDNALHLIDVARRTGVTNTPMQRVRLETAHGHILLSDPATRDDGLHVLDEAVTEAAEYGLRHQLRSIKNIRAEGEQTPCIRRT